MYKFNYETEEGATKLYQFLIEKCPTLEIGDRFTKNNLKSLGKDQDLSDDLSTEISDHFDDIRREKFDYTMLDRKNKVYEIHTFK